MLRRERCSEQSPDDFGDARAGPEIVLPAVRGRPPEECGFELRKLRVVEGGVGAGMGDGCESGITAFASCLDPFGDGPVDDAEHFGDLGLGTALIEENHGPTASGFEFGCGSLGSHGVGIGKIHGDR